MLTVSDTDQCSISLKTKTNSCCGSCVIVCLMKVMSATVRKRNSGMVILRPRLGGFVWDGYDRCRVNTFTGVSMSVYVSPTIV